jgi:hypothetical protein
MSTNQRPPNQNGKTDDCGCHDKEKDNATQVSIKTNRTDLCKLLYDERGTVSKWETKFSGEKEIFKEKRCIFLNTEKNYRLYRNFEIVTGTELNQSNVSIKASVAQIKGWNKDLNSTLTALAKQIKDLKTKFGDLKDAACKLDSSYEDKCNIGQKKALTGIVPENCPDPGPPIDACKDSATIIEGLICRPKGLAKDIDSIFQASSDVVGIQIFSNIDSLDQLQTDLAAKSTSFEKMISDAMKTRKTELDTIQNDLVNSVKTITQVAVSRNSERALFEGLYDATDFLCCPACTCIPDDEHEKSDRQAYRSDHHKKDDKECHDECPPRLKECEQAICEICDEVKKTFCCEADNPSDPSQTSEMA